MTVSQDCGSKESYLDIPNLSNCLVSPLTPNWHTKNTLLTLQCILKRAKKRLNLLKALRGQSWGASPQTIIYSFRTYTIRPIMEYGAALFAHATYRTCCILGRRVFTIYKYMTHKYGDRYLKYWIIRNTFITIVLLKLVIHIWLIDTWHPNMVIGI